MACSWKDGGRLIGIAVHTEDGVRACGMGATMSTLMKSLMLQWQSGRWALTIRTVMDGRMDTCKASASA